jgi:hypothetical protein
MRLPQIAATAIEWTAPATGAARRSSDIATNRRSVGLVARNHWRHDSPPPADAHRLTASRDPGYPSADRGPTGGASKGVTVSDKSPHKASAKKQGQTLKEKRAAKKMKKIRLADNASKVPPTGH